MPALGNGSRNSAGILVRKSCGNVCRKILWEILVGNVCRKILWQNLAGNVCGKFLWENLVGNVCGKIMWEIIAGKSCGKCLRENLVGKSCGKCLQEILMGKSCRKCLQENLAGNSCGKILQEILAGNVCGKILWEILVGKSCTNSTPIRNTNARSDQPGVYFNTNPVHQVYATTSDRGEQYKQPENDSIVQGATSPVDQLVTNATDAAGHNEPWRQNNTTNISSNTFNHRTTTRPTSSNGLQTNNPSNPTDLRNGPTCFRCGEQGHMRGECRTRVFCNHCRSYNHDTKACRKHMTIPRARPIAK